MKYVARLVCLAIACAAGPVQAKPFWDEPWVEVRSPHFDVVSGISQQRTANLVNDLENFRAAVALVTNITEFDQRVPTKIYLFDRRDAAFIDAGFAGWFMPRMRANYAVVIPDSRLGLATAIKHEYTHFLLHNRNAARYPRWFDEGFAMKLDTMEVHDKVIQYGQPSLNVLQNLEYGAWIGFGKVLGTRNVFELADNERTMFYVQCWLLTFYLMERPDHDFGAEMRAYLASAEAGAEPVDAFNAAFALRAEQLRPILLDYLHRKLRTTTIKLKMPFPTPPTQTTTVAPDSIAAQLGNLLLLRGFESEAKRYFDAALAIEPGNGDALVGLGDLLKFAGEFDEAQPYYEKAIAHEPTNAYHELDYGEYFADRGSARSDQLAADMVEARRHFARAYALDPTIPETLAMNGATYLDEGQSIDKALASLNEAHAMLPAQPDVAMLLAKAYARSNRKADAVKLLRACIAWGSESSSKDSDAATKLLAELTGSDDSAEPSSDQDAH